MSGLALHLIPMVQYSNGGSGEGEKSEVEKGYRLGDGCASIVDPHSGGLDHIDTMMQEFEKKIVNIG